MTYKIQFTLFSYLTQKYLHRWMNIYNLISIQSILSHIQNTYQL